MGKTVQLRNLVIGEGAPKICVPLTGRTREELVEEAENLAAMDFDIVEWRADFFEGVDSKEDVLTALAEITSRLPDTPLLFTFRTAKEGGEKEITEEEYFGLNRNAAASGKVDLIDLELFNNEAAIREAVDFAHRHKVAVIISNHDFDQTPDKEEIIARLRKAETLGADLPKIAVMPKSPADVLTLLDATYTMKESYAEQPIITMAMGGEGVVSRLAGEVFGSAVTFGAAKKASAPGQINVAELRGILTLFHENKAR